MGMVEDLSSLAMDRAENFSEPWARAMENAASIMSSALNLLFTGIGNLKKH
jgi:hypothetical protein